MQAEKRLHPRVGVDLPAELEPYGGECFDVRLINLSLGGLLVEGDEQLEKLIDVNRRTAGAAPVEVNIHFGLEQGAVHCHCRLIHMHRLAQNRFQMGMKILSIADTHHQSLSRFIEARLH